VNCHNALWKYEHKQLQIHTTDASYSNEMCSARSSSAVHTTRKLHRYQAVPVFLAFYILPVNLFDLCSVLLRQHVSNTAVP